MLSLFGERLLPRLAQSADMLSYANRRRLEIARALVAGPQLILLDEPTAGMNPHETQGIVDLIRLIREQGHTVLVIEHNSEVIRRADHVLDLGPEGGVGGGELMASGSLEDLMNCQASYTGAMLRGMFG